MNKGQAPWAIIKHIKVELPIDVINGLIEAIKQMNAELTADTIFYVVDDSEVAEKMELTIYSEDPMTFYNLGLRTDELIKSSLQNLKSNRV